jgi:hypothetical protein
MSLVNLAGNIVTPNYDSLYLVHSAVLDEAVDDHNAMIDGAVGKLVVINDGEAKIDVEDKLLRRTMTSHQASLPQSKAGSKKSKGGKMHTHNLDTWGVEYFQPTKPEEHGYYIAFSCPIFERIDKIRPTRVLEDKAPGKTWGGYFNPANRAEIAIPWYSYLFFTAISLLLGSISLLPIGLISKFREGGGTHEQRVWIACWTIFGFVIGTFAGFWTSVLDLKTFHGVGLNKWVKFLGKILFAAVFAAPGVGGFIMVGKMLREYGNCVSLF